MDASKAYNNLHNITSDHPLYPKRSHTQNRNNNDLNKLYSTPQFPFSHKNRRYMLKLIYMDMPQVGRKKLAFKIPHKVPKSSLDFYPQDANRTAEIQINTHKNHNLSFENTIPEYSRNLNKRANYTTNRSFLETSQNDKLSDNLGGGKTIYISKNKSGNQSSFGSALKKSRTRSRQYVFKTAHSIKKSQSKEREKSSEQGTLIKLEQSQKILKNGKDELKRHGYDKAMTLFEQAYRVNPSNIEALLYKGVVLMDTGKTQNAIKVLKEVISQKTEGAKSGYLLLAIAYKKTNNHELAINTLNEVLRKYPKYIEALISRANLYLITKKFAQAKEDFLYAIELDKSPNMNSKNVTVFLGLAECEENLSNYTDAVKWYNNAISANSTKIPIHIYLKKAKCEYKQKEYKSALESIEKYLLQNETNSEALILKGRILDKQKMIGDAALQFEQAAKDNRPQIASKSLFKLAKMRLNEKDYYEAYFEMRRAFQFKCEYSKKMELYRTLLDGIVALMKKKHKSGLKYLAQIEPDIKIFKNHIQNLFHLFKGFGHMVQHQFNVIL